MRGISKCQALSRVVVGAIETACGLCVGMLSSMLDQGRASN